MIPFNKPYFSGNELQYIEEAINNGHISGNGPFTKQCHKFFEDKYGFSKCLLTTSCTDALEMAAILLNVKEGDEVIMPSFTFVSTANAFVLRGAKIVFADSRADHPGIDENCVENLITPKTKAIVVVHYAGVACDMDKILQIAGKHKIYVVEDAAQAVDSFYKGRPLGSFGNLSTFSFHETKNISSGEGGMLVVNDEQFRKRAEIIWEKGTDRAAFFRGEKDKYGWVDIGSSFLPSDIISAFLLAQLETVDYIQIRRKEIWYQYYEGLSDIQAKGQIQLPFLPDYSTNNAHMFYFLCKNETVRSNVLSNLKKHGIKAIFHYLPLHKSEYYKDKYIGKELENCCFYSNSIIRLPLYIGLTDVEIQYMVDIIKRFFMKNSRRIPI